MTDKEYKLIKGLSMLQRDVDWALEKGLKDEYEIAELKLSTYQIKYTDELMDYYRKVEVQQGVGQ